MGYRSAVAAARRLNGLIPVYKERGLHFLDLMDLIRMTIEFEMGIKFSKIGLMYNLSPKLRKEDEGIVHVGFGTKANRDMSHLRYAIVGYHVCAHLGDRMPCLSGGSRTFEAVSASQVAQAIKQISEQKVQVRVPLERQVRDRVTERNKIRAPTHGAFYEGSQPRLVNVYSINNVACDSPHFEFDLEVNPKLCVHRFVDDVGLKLDTFARIDRLILNRYMDIRAEDCLRQHELYTEEIVSKLKGDADRYEDLISRCYEMRCEYGFMPDKYQVKYMSPWS